MKDIIYLIPPYISGTGKDLSEFRVFHEPPELVIGMVLGVGKGFTHIRVMQVATTEDFFENISVALCQMITNNSEDTVPQDIKKLEPMYTTYSEQP